MIERRRARALKNVARGLSLSAQSASLHDVHYPALVVSLSLYNTQKAKAR
jgi:hypothetical protein